jgi:hypothetical protein
LSTIGVPGYDGIGLRLLVTLTVTTSLGPILAGAGGKRAVINVTGGEFAGDRLRGIVHASGGDWLSLPNETAPRIDARLVLETDDAVAILLRYEGVVSERAGNRVAQIAARFEAPAGPYAWLNDILAIGAGSAINGGATYRLYQVV